MTSPENATQVKEFIPESWYDLICRMVPGSLILAITLRKYASQDIKITSLAIGVIGAYAIGFFMEMASSVALHRLPENHWIRSFCTRRLFPLRCPKFADWKRSQVHIQSNLVKKYTNLWEKLDKSSILSARQTTLKMLAEISMIRTFAFYFFLQFCGGLLLSLLHFLCPALIALFKSYSPVVLIDLVRDFFVFPWLPSLAISLYLGYLWINHFKNVADRIARINN